MTRIICSIIFLFLGTMYICAQSTRSIDGSFNNIFNPAWGSTGDVMQRSTHVGFADLIAAPGGLNRPNPRDISNSLFSQEDVISDVKNLSDFVWVFGQFIDHDITYVLDDVTEPLAIAIPDNDKIFVPGGPPIFMFRSLASQGTGTSINNPRAYFNDVTAFIDGSVIYGSDRNRASWLRSFEDGKLKTSEGNLLPWNTITGEFNDPIDSNAPYMDNATGITTKLYLAGDARANENPLLISFHTIFVREHNRLCDQFRSNNPDWTDEELFQTARRWNGAFLQKITYDEWLTAMGITLPVYRGYQTDVNPQIMNVFSAAAFRVGHTLINSNLLRLDGNGEKIASGHIGLRDAFFNPSVINLAGGLEPYLRGMASQVQQKMDPKVIDDVRNFLFGGPESGGLDLAAININRGRERGLPDYNTVRSNFGLPKIKTFSEITKSAEVSDELYKLYVSVDNIDPWVGMLSEDYMPDAILGSTLMHIIERQFRILRDGDRYYYEGDRFFDEEDIAQIKSTTMRDIIMRNTDIKLMQANVFQAMEPEMLNRGPELEQVALSAEIFPNPTVGQFEIKLFMDSEQDVTISVFDNLGRQIYSSVETVQEGNNFIECNIDEQTVSNFYNVLIQQDQLNYRILRVFKH